MMIANPTANVLSTEITSSALVVYLIQWAKNSKWFAFIKADSKRLLQILSALGAGLGTIGVNYAWDSSARTLTFQIPTMIGASILFWHWLNHVAMQEIIYQSTKKVTNATSTK